MSNAALLTCDDQVINVASMPSLSPFRYPGGKTWLVPHIRKWFAGLQSHPAEFIEPFAGGGIVSLTVAYELLADQVTMAELDDEIAAVWQTILNKNGHWLANQIVTFNFTKRNIEATLARPASSLRAKAFRTILKNRINRGGIIAPGAGKLKRGENGKGIRSRWYPETLRKRILNIATMRDRITFIAGDGLKVLRQNAQRADALFFIDPPYRMAGSRLYTHFELDHSELFRVSNTLVGDFLMTYDDCEEIRGLAWQYNFDVQAVPMKNTHHARKFELLIGRNLDWARTSSGMK